MRKVLSRVGAIVAFLGFMLTLGAVGGIEHETSTWSQFWSIIAYSVPMCFIGIRLAKLYSWQ